MNELQQILADYYDVSIISAPVVAIEWALQRIEDTESAKLQLKLVNKKRIAHGVIPLHLPYGHRLF